MVERLPSPTPPVTEEHILAAIQGWLADTTEPIVGWEWNGETLEIDNGTEVERYDRQTVLEEMVAAR